MKELCFSIKQSGRGKKKSDVNFPVLGIEASDKTLADCPDEPHLKFGKFWLQRVEQGRWRTRIAKGIQLELQ